MARAKTPGCTGIDRPKLISEARRHLSVETNLADDVARIKTALLVCHLREQAREYKENILPLYPDDDPPMPADESDSFETFDSEKNEFLENLWDVIYQHFTDLGDV